MPSSGVPSWIRTARESLARWTDPARVDLTPPGPPVVASGRSGRTGRRTPLYLIHAVGLDYRSAAGTRGIHVPTSVYWRPCCPCRPNRDGESEARSTAATHRVETAVHTVHAVHHRAKRWRLSPLQAQTAVQVVHLSVGRENHLIARIQANRSPTMAVPPEGTRLWPLIRDGQAHSPWILSHDQEDSRPDSRFAGAIL